MRIYLSSNIGGGEAKYEILWILAGVRNRLFSYYYHSKCSGMNLYFAGGENKSWLSAIEKAGGEKSLYSYFYLLKDNQRIEKAFDFMSQARQSQKYIFLDSGAFTAKSKGADIPLTGYIDFIKRSPGIDTYAALDVIGDYKGTAKNVAIMEQAGLHPLPTFHYGSPLKELRRLVERYKYIALGGMVPLARSKEKLRAWLTTCFSIGGREKKFHGFGMTNIVLLKEFPFYSVDSTSWLGGSMRGEIYKFKDGLLHSIRVSEADNGADRHASISYIDQGDKRWRPRVINNAIEWIKYEKYLTDLWKKRGVEWKD